jgi:hypothetical protein
MALEQPIWLRVANLRSYCYCWLGSFPTAISVVSSDYFEDDQRITIEVAPAGNYLYQLDDGALQSQNVFIDVAPGTYTVHIKSECGDYTREVTLLDFPRFFTPNGDGYNDHWNIFSLNGQAKAKFISLTDLENCSKKSALLALAGTEHSISKLCRHLTIGSSFIMKISIMSARYLSPILH